MVVEVVVLGTHQVRDIVEITQVQVEMVAEPAATPHILATVEEWVPTLLP
jgi:hypothetical protein